jgi:hypothetical protein
MPGQQPSFAIADGASFDANLASFFESLEAADAALVARLKRTAPSSPGRGRPGRGTRCALGGGRRDRSHMSGWFLRAITIEDFRGINNEGEDTAEASVLTR